MSNQLASYVIPVVPVDPVSNDVILRDELNEATVYTQRTNGWVLTHGGNSIAKCDEFGRLFTRSYQLAVTYQGPWATSTPGVIIVHELGFLVMLQFRAIAAKAADAAANIMTTVELPASLRPLHAVAGTMLATSDSAGVVGKWSITQMGSVVLEAGIGTKFAATGNAAFADFAAIYDRRV